MSSLVLVTGGTGFIGSRLVKKLLEQGFRVRVMMRKSSSDERIRGLPFERAEGDLKDKKSLLSAVEGVSVVYHLAAAISEKNAAAYFERNTEGTLNLLEAIKERNPNLSRFVFTSSMAAGGPAHSIQPRTESQEPAPVSHYGESKLRAEQEILKFKETVSMIILRPPIVYGPGDRAILTALAPLKAGIIPMVGAQTDDRRKKYSAIYVEDLVDALCRAGSSKVKSGEVFYTTHSEIITMEQIFESAAMTLKKKVRFVRIPYFVVWILGWLANGLSRITGKDYPLNPDKVKELRPDYWICSHQKAKDLLGFEAQTPFKEGFEVTVRGYQEAGWL